MASTCNDHCHKYLVANFQKNPLTSAIIIASNNLVWNFLSALRINAIKDRGTHKNWSLIVMQNRETYGL